MKKAITLAGVALLVAAGTVLADDTTSTTTSSTTTTSDRSMKYDQDPNEMYRASELSLGLFGMGTVGQYTLEHPSNDRVRHNGRGGAGVDLEYFFCKYVGVEAEAWTQNTAHNFVDDVAGNLVLRLPIGHTGLAPYAFGGGGHSFDPVVATFGQFGAGLEFRFTPHFGLFVDGRYVIPDRLGNYGLGRAGLRFAF